MKYLAALCAVVMMVTLTGCSDDPATPADEGPPTTSVTTQAPTTTSATVTNVDSAPTTTAPTVTTTLAPSPTRTSTPAVPAPWDVWTLIYASLDANSHTAEEADALAGTVDDGAVLLSDDYPSLNSGYWVVYAGQWPSHDQAGASCPSDLDDSLTCYPRYLGPSWSQLHDEGAAIAQLEWRLVALAPETGEVLATFADGFHYDAFPARFNLTSDVEELFFSLGWEDSWYSCESDKGEIRRLNLGTGIEETFSDGWAPAISPDGRWLAIVSAARCYPDPEMDEWVITPGSQVEVFDLTDGDSAPDHVLRPRTPPTSYEDGQGVIGVFWDPATDGDLLVALADESVRRIRYDSTTTLDSAPVEFPTRAWSLAAVTTAEVFFVDYNDGLSTVERVNRGEAGRSETVEVDGWISTIAVNRDGDVILATWDRMILPSGESVEIEGLANLAW